MKDVVATINECRLVELFQRLRSVCAEYARCGEAGCQGAAVAEIRQLRTRIVELCSRPVMPLDWVELEEAAIHGGRGFVEEVVSMAGAFLEAGGRVVLIRRSALNAPAEIVGDFCVREKFDSYAQRWL